MNETSHNVDNDRAERLQQFQNYYQTIATKARTLLEKLDTNDTKVLGITQLLGRILEHYYPDSSHAISFEALIGSTLRMTNDYSLEPKEYSLNKILDELLSSSFKTPEKVLLYCFQQLNIPRDEWLINVLLRESYDISGFGF